MKKLIIILLLATISCHLFAAEPEMSGKERGVVHFYYGLQWGISGNSYNSDISTYITDVQSLVQLKTINPFFHINGEIMASVGIDIGRRFNLEVAAGYAGIRKNLRFFPIEINGKYFTRKGQGSGSYFQIGGGWGLCENPNHRYACYSRGGYGYRIDVGNGLAMDIKALMQVSYSHPDVYDKYTGEIVPFSNLRQSDSISLNTLVCLALIF